ncbi:MAG: PaREP1/PaREP8 domain-contain protein [Chloroflexi bacterium]|nr:PaREP1 family protein [Chloroflexota bacterium]MXV79603.1 PaREP1/PaREP8 domain-contain protein [Chloroflexota bacterium]MYA02497.1 PaREP1/PaREP8 domain-contain protein [Chloroflexota bacterium]MYG91134.1 PaREP1/PaREP8 domain-contain protein [Chloroflexota bacterium]MYJ93243.1 PaREP1/PaREP8 domain-contain protein [Chloroflexota bacterium]
MTTEQVTHYRELSAEYLDHARALLAEGDLPQASEKGWGAASVLVKAVAEARGWRHEGHRELWWALAQLADETNDGEMRRQFGLAGALHTNYYEAWLDEKAVAQYLGEVEQLVEKLDGLA